MNTPAKKNVITPIEKSNTQINPKITGYVATASVTKTIIKKSTQNISAVSFNTARGLAERTMLFDSYARVINGKAGIFSNTFPIQFNRAAE